MSPTFNARRPILTRATLPNKVVFHPNEMLKLAAPRNKVACRQLSSAAEVFLVFAHERSRISSGFRAECIKFKRAGKHK